MNIRLAENTDLHVIHAIIQAAFLDDEAAIIRAVASRLLSDTSKPSFKSFVAEYDGQVIGYVSYSPISCHSDGKISGYILAPLAVSPAYQKQGVGSHLIKSGIDMLIEDGADVLLVYGDHGYYGRFGFQVETAGLFVPPYPLQYPFGWMGLMLNETARPDAPIKFNCVGALANADLW